MAAPLWGRAGVAAPGPLSQSAVPRLHRVKFLSTVVAMSEGWRALSRDGYLGERRKEALKRYMGYGPAFVSEEVVGYPVKPARTLYISQKKKLGLCITSLAHTGLVH